MKHIFLFIIVVLIAGCAGRTNSCKIDKPISPEIVLAAFNGDTASLNKFLLEGVNSNSVYGENDPQALNVNEGDSTDPVTGEIYQNIALAETRGCEDWTPLYALAISNLVEDKVPIAKSLLSYGADIDKKCGWTALAYAIYKIHVKGNDKLALYLISRGANINSPTASSREGGTILHDSISCPEVVAALIKKGINVNAQDSNGNTALHYAVRNARHNKGFVETARLLVRAGSNVNLKNNENETAIRWVISPDNENEKNVYKLLIDAGATLPSKQPD